MQLAPDDSVTDQSGRFPLPRFSKALDGSFAAGIKNANVSGLSLGFSQLVLFCSYALCFWYVMDRCIVCCKPDHSWANMVNNCVVRVGGKFIEDGRLTFAEMMKVHAYRLARRVSDTSTHWCLRFTSIGVQVVFAIVICAMGAGQAVQMAPDLQGSESGNFFLRLTRSSVRT